MLTEINKAKLMFLRKHNKYPTKVKLSPKGRNELRMETNSLRIQFVDPEKEGTSCMLNGLRLLYDATQKEPFILEE